MKVLLIGHNERYAIEQSLLAFFPDERPVYDEDADDRAYVRSTLHISPVWETAVTEIRWDGRRAQAIARSRRGGASSPREQTRERQRVIKQSFFKAARKLLEEEPPWGALTGIRPAKLAARYLQQGKTLAQTDQILRKTYFITPSRRRLCLEAAQAGLRADAGLRDDEISLYVGIPFCPTRCAYCSFVSNSVEKSFPLIEPYLDALCAEAAAAGRMVRELGLRVKSFYMGGGTPTTLSAEQLDRLLSVLEESFDFSRLAEQTVEAGRPDTVDRARLEVLRRHNTTRISINPQSMEPHVLRAIGRRHSPEQIAEAVALAQSIGFPHVNMDVIAGLPEDTVDGFRRTLDTVLGFGVDNVTVHTLSLKKGSRLMLEGSAIPSAKEVGAMLDYADPTLRQAGFRPYYLYRQKYMSGSFENVGWCKPGAEGLYNIYIMEELHTILSLGAGGSTKMVDRKNDRIERVFNLKYPAEYIQRPEKVAENQAAFVKFLQNR